MVKKATKKFNKHHLAPELQRRKVANKIKSAQEQKQRKLELKVAGGKNNSKSDKGAGFIDEEEEGGGLGEWKKKGFFDEDFQGSDGSDESGDDGQSGGSSPAAHDSADADSDASAQGEESDEDADQNLRKFNSQMKNLAKQDPEFYQYLKSNDKALLAAAEDDDDEDEDDGSDNGEQESDGDDAEGYDEQDEDDAAAAEKVGEIITPELFESMQAAASAGGGKNLKALRALVQAFAAAFQQESRGGASVSPYVITSGVVFQRVASLCIGSMGHMFDVYFDVKPLPGGAGSSNTRPTASAQWRRGRAVVKTYLSALVHALTDAPDASMCHHLLRHCQSLLPYFAPFPRLSRLLLKQALAAWGQKEKVGVQAFLVIRSMALACPFPFIELTFKGCYIAFGRHTGIAPASTQQRQQQEFLAQCVVELYSLDAAAAYEHAFVYLRELAVQMRQGIASKTSAAVSEVTSWSFLNRFSLWGRAICAMPSKTGGLGDLVYPYIQMAMALLKFVQGARLSPLRLHVIRACLRVTQHASVYVPLAPPLLEMFRFPEVAKSSNVTGTAVNMECSIKISATALRTRAACDSIVTAALAMLHKFCCLHATSVAFPELVLPIHKELKEFVNSTSSPKRRRQAKDLLERIARNSEWAMKQRESIVFDVTNLSQCALLQGSAPLLKGAGRADAAWGSQGWGLQDDDEVEQQEEQRRLERKSKRQGDESAEEDGDDDGSGEDDEEGGSAPLDSEKSKKQQAKNSKQKANRKEKKKLKLRASSIAAATGDDVVEDLEFSD